MKVFDFRQFLIMNVVHAFEFRLQSVNNNGNDSNNTQNLARFLMEAKVHSGLRKAHLLINEHYILNLT